MPGVDLKQQRSQQISERTVTAMYMNNRAAETLRGGEVDEAYWWARGALMADPRFLEAINTLGVIYSQRGNLVQAERVFRHVLATEAENVSAMANLVRVLERTGKQAESVALAERLRRVEPHPPFHFFDLGVAALARGDFAGARDLFQQELRRNSYYHEAHFGLAMAYYGLGEVRATREHLAAAREASTNTEEQNRYAAKLAWLTFKTRKSLGYDTYDELAELDTETVRDYCRRELNEELLQYCGRPLVSDPDLAAVFRARRTRLRPLRVDQAPKLAESGLARRLAGCPIAEPGVTAV